MKKSLFALAALGAVSGVAHADVTLYGILDLGVAELTHAGNFSPTFVTGASPTGAGSYQKLGTTIGMMNGGEYQTRWGIKGSEDLGNGSQAFFRLESAISASNGMIASSGLAGAGLPNKSASMVVDTSLNGQLFGRAALVGLSNNDLGTLTLGRQNSLELDIITGISGGYDPVNAQMFSPINFSGFYGGGGATDSARVDNSVKYSKNFGDWGLNVLYGIGGMAGNTSARSTGEASFGYEGKRFGFELAAQEAQDSTNIVSDPTAGTVGAQFLNLKSFTGTLRYQVIDPLKLTAGYQRIQWSTPGNPAADATLSQVYGYTINPLNAFTGEFIGEKNYNIYWVGGKYQVTRAFRLSAGYYDAQLQSGNYNSVNGFNGGATKVQPSGSDQYLSLLADYDLSKRTNLYAGLMFDKKSGGQIPGGPTGGQPTTYNTYGVGIVHRF
ncbi:MAG: porin [Betaproteobacteria bacterium]|nr:porin [Betaproteobacteria bacterium]